MIFVVAQHLATQDAMPRELIGETLLNQFRIDRFIAAGGMATIYRVWDLKRSVPLAMKVLHPEYASDPSLMARFEREAQSLQMLVHPHIVPFYGLYRAGDITFLLERYIDGPSLDEVLRWHGRDRHRESGEAGLGATKISESGGWSLPLVEALVYFKGVFTSLGYAHAQGIIHCDVKPGNVLVDQGGHVYLTDFGIARYMDTAVTTSSGLGTPLYMAPEQILGERLSARTDIYALGVLLFELLTGARPFTGDTGVPPEVGENPSDRIRYQQIYVPPPDPRSLNPQIPERLAQVVLRALAKDPEQRYPSVQAMADEIAAAVAARFETLPNRVRIPEELIRLDAGWRPEPPPAADATAAMQEREPAAGDTASFVAEPGGAAPPHGAGAPHYDTLIGYPRPENQPPGGPASAAVDTPTRPRARLSPRLAALLGGLALLAVCVLGAAGIARAFRDGRFSPPGNLPGLPTQTGPALGPTHPPGETASPQAVTPTTGLQPTGTAGPQSISVSGEIAIVQRSAGTDRLLLLDAASGQATELPPVPNVKVTGANAPQWSPDGQRLVWIGQYNNRSHVVVMDMTEREPYQLPSGETYPRVSAPAFLPDGQTVSFWASGVGGGYLVTANAATGEEVDKIALKTYRSMFAWSRQQNLVAFVLPGGSSYKVALSDAPDGAARPVDTGGEGYAPAWSNDGQWLAFQSDMNRGAGLDEIWVARADGSDLHAVTSTPAEFWCRAPSWSPDGRMIAFISNQTGSRGNDYGELFVVDLATGETRQVTSTGGMVYDWRPAWRPK